MSKRMGLLKTLRTGGGLGAGPFPPGACFLQENHQRWGLELLPQFPASAMSLGLLSCQQNAQGSPPGVTHGAASPLTAAQCSHYHPRRPAGTLTAPVWVLQCFGPQTCPLAGTAHGFSHVPALQAKPDRLEQLVTGVWARDNRLALGTGGIGTAAAPAGIYGAGGTWGIPVPPPTCPPDCLGD